MRLLKYIADRFKENPEIAVKALKIGSNLKFVPQKIQNKSEIQIKRIDIDCYYVPQKDLDAINYYISKKKRKFNTINPVYFNKENLEKNPDYQGILENYYKWLPKYMKVDPEISFIANSKYNLLDKSLKDNYEFNLKLVKENKHIFKKLNKKYRKDTKIIITAIIGDAQNIWYSEKRDRNFIKKICKYNYEILYHMNENTRNDINFWLELLMEHSSKLILEYAPAKIHNYLIENCA